MLNMILIKGVEERYLPSTCTSIRTVPTYHVPLYRELAFLSLTSRAMHLLVAEFLQHNCSLLRPRLRAFYERHSELLLPKEEVLRQRMECNSRHELLLYSARRQFAGNVRRCSLTK